LGNAQEFLDSLLSPGNKRGPFQEISGWIAYEKEFREDGKVRLILLTL
jgi:hypothetical protein